MNPDFGVCLYRPGPEPGTLLAEWYEPGLPAGQPCTGLATDGPPHGLVGNYNVVYNGPDGQPVARFSLTIEQAGGVFHLTWEKDGHTACVGVGLPCGNGIALAYRTTP